jgi:hypothetical protein
MQSIVYALVIKWFCSQIAALGSSFAWPTFKTTVNQHVAALLGTMHAGFASPQVTAWVDEVVDAIQKLSQDGADLSSVLSALASKNPAAAEAALKTMLLGVTSGDLAALVKAA